jgi:hypothetical protein
VPALLGAVVTLCIAACAIFLGVLITEIDYVYDHPFRYGPAKVIAWGAGGGALLSLAVALHAVATLRARRQ